MSELVHSLSVHVWLVSGSGDSNEFMSQFHNRYQAPHPKSIIKSDRLIHRVNSPPIVSYRLDVCIPEMLPKFRRQSREQMDAVGSPDLHQLTLLAFATRWTSRVCPLPLANGMTLPTISTTGFLTVSIPKRL